jgi:hypothetical protein
MRSIILAHGWRTAYKTPRHRRPISSKHTSHRRLFFSVGTVDFDAVGMTRSIGKDDTDGGMDSTGCWGQAQRTPARCAHARTTETKRTWRQRNKRSGWKFGNSHKTTSILGQRPRVNHSDRPPFGPLVERFASGRRDRPRQPNFLLQPAPASRAGLHRSHDACFLYFRGETSCFLSDPVSALKAHHLWRD